MDESMIDAAQESAAWSKSYDEQKAAEAAAKSEPPRSPFTPPPEGSSLPTAAVLHAVHMADTLGSLAHPIYRHVRDSVVAFTMEYKPGTVDNAIARLCIPLVGYARLLGNVTTIARYGHHYSDRGVKPTLKVNLPDVYALGTSTETCFTTALQAADPDAYREYIRFLAGTHTEESLDAELQKHVRPVQAAVLTLTAAVLRDGTRALRNAMDNGARTTDDLLPPPSHLGGSERTGERGHGVYLSGKPPEGSDHENG